MTHRSEPQPETERPRRERGEGAIYPVAGGGFRGAIRLTDPQTGRTMRRYVSGRSRAAVSRKLEKLKRDAAKGDPTSSRLTVAEYLTRWLESGRARVRPSTWRQREQHVRTYIVPNVGARRLAALQPADVERMTGKMLADALSPRTAASARVILRRALADAVRDGLAPRNAAALARPPRIPTRTLEAGRDYLEPADVRRLIESSKDEPLGPLVTVAATTGLRQGEVLGLSWDDIDLEARTLTVRRALARAWGDGWELAEPKTPRSRRTIGLPQAAIEALTRRLDAQDAEKRAAGTAWQDVDGLVFTDELGRPMRGYRVTRGFHGLLDGEGLPSIPFHGLRHSAATALLAAGVPLRTVADVLGHSTITITADTYAAVVPELRRDAADAMDRALGAES